MQAHSNENSGNSRKDNPTPIFSFSSVPVEFFSFAGISKMNEESDLFAEFVLIARSIDRVVH
jgi:hypothetical protein